MPESTPLTALAAAPAIDSTPEMKPWISATPAPKSAPDRSPSAPIARSRSEPTSATALPTPVCTAATMLAHAAWAADWMAPQAAEATSCAAARPI
jgi:hypothetical protein